MTDAEILALWDSVPTTDDDEAFVITYSRALIAATREEILPKGPSIGLLVSMAIRFDHGLGVPGYYDQPSQVIGVAGQGHKAVMDSTIRQMRQLYEEVSGHGFYKPEREAEYAALATAQPSEG